MFNFSPVRRLTRLTSAALAVIVLSAAMSVNADDFQISPMTSMALDESKTVSRIAFGSCAVSTNSQEIFTTIKNTDSDLFLFIGDNVYAKTEKDDPELKSLRASYKQLSESKPFQQLRDTTPLLVTWDDHDYGINDGGGDYPKKIEAESLFFDFWQVPSDDPRRSREGVYFDYKKNADGVIIHFIGLDTRYFRSPLPDKNTKLNLIDRANDTVLGESQWEWLTQTLDSSNADLIVILSSIQVLATDHPYEKWSNFPLERARLISMLSSAAQNKTVITLSGDRHRSGFYQLDNLIELTASPLNKVSSQNPEFDPLLLNKTYPEINYGILDLQVEKLRVALSLHDGVGDLLEQHYVPLKSHN